MNIGNFASTFAYRNFLKSFFIFSWSSHGPTGLVRRSPAEIKAMKVNYQLIQKKKNFFYHIEEVYCFQTFHLGPFPHL